MTFEITPKELLEKQKNKEEFLLLDVREEWEYEEFNIGGTLIPLHDLPTRIDEIKGWESKSIVVHCKSGKRSRQARNYLTQQGFDHVKCLEGGIDAFDQYQANR